jgi:hypothetical protein
MTCEASTPLDYAKLNIKIVYNEPELANSTLRKKGITGSG